MPSHSDRVSLHCVGSITVADVQALRVNPLPEGNSPHIGLPSLQGRSICRIHAFEDWHSDRSIGRCVLSGVAKFLNLQGSSTLILGLFEIPVKIAAYLAFAKNNPCLDF